MSTTLSIREAERVLVADSAEAVSFARAMVAGFAMASSASSMVGMPSATAPPLDTAASRDRSAR